MSPGAIALAAVIVLGTHDAIIFGVVGWLFYKQRLLFAASPKPQAQQAPAVEPVATMRRTG